MVEIFEYQNYRQYLSDYYSEAKRLKPHFSFRSFAMKAKLNSPNYLKLVIDGKRRITEAQIPKFVTGLSLKNYEASYFIGMVNLENTPTEEMRTYYANQLRHLKKISKASPQILDENIQEQLSHWEIWLLREYFQIPNISIHPEQILKNFIFPTQKEKIQNSLETLLKLGLLERSDSGIRATQSILIMGDKIKSEALKNLHKEYLDLAKESIDKVPKSDRRLAGLTLALKKSDFEQISKQFLKYISDLNKAHSETQNPEEIYHLEFAFFPLTQNRRSS